MKRRDVHDWDLCVVHLRGETVSGLYSYETRDAL